MPEEVAHNSDDNSVEPTPWLLAKRRGPTRNVRYIGYIGGRYTLPSRGTGRSKRPSVFACRTQSISPKMAVVLAPVVGSLGEKVTANFNDLGLVRGTITRFVDGGFALAVEASDEERSQLAARIDWFRRKRELSLPDQREHRRFLPRNPRSTLTLASGKNVTCFIINMSISGVAVSADLTPRLGAPLAVGRVVGRVVRQLEVGFAVRFLSPQDPAHLEALLVSKR